MQYIKSSSTGDIQPHLKKLTLPEKNSHKGQNGKVLIIGGSTLFHAASLWSAEIASHFADMVHYCSTDENNGIFQSLKKIFRNGIAVPRSEMESYIEEDDVILVGPGLERNEGTKTLTEEVIRKTTGKKLVLDAGSLQMMNVDGLSKRKVPAIITPHHKEYEAMFKVSISNLSVAEKVKDVEEKAKKYNCIILLKTVLDIISDGSTSYVVEGGNQGLTKGGTGDILAGLTASLFAHTDGLTAAVLSSFLLKRTSDELFKSKGYWYNNSDILDTIPKIANKIFL